MPNILVRDVANDVHASLLRRAAAEGRSLQQYLAAELIRMATTPSRADVLARIEQRRGGRFEVDDVVEAVRSVRAER